MTYITNRDWWQAVANDEISGYRSLNKFGRNTDCDSGVKEDIWDNGPTTAVWVAPTAARIHTIASTVAADDSTGTGAKTIQIYGLTDWDTAETSETITMAGTSGVPTSNSYVIIHRMKVLTKGSAGPNSGVITATAATDSTITAQINAGEGQTQMAIYGVPSVNELHLHHYYASAIKSTGAVASISLLVNPEPDAELTSFLTKHTNGISKDGSNYIRHEFNPPSVISGPAIIKLQANASANDTDVSAGFDGVLKTV